MRDWVADPDGTYYLLGSAVGAHPYPYLVRELQSIIGREARAQIQEQSGGLPDLVIACVGGGSNAIGLFHPFVADRGVARERCRLHNRKCLARQATPAALQHAARDGTRGDRG